MEMYSSADNYKLYHGSMLDLLEVIEENTIDAVVTDPPYELNFMNKGWDNSGIAFQKDTWEKCLKALKPGGYLLAFGGSRTFHRIACAIEDAGFEIRDTVMWLYGSGFPKSMDIAKYIDKHFGERGEKVGERRFGKTSTGQKSGWNNNNVAQSGKQDVYSLITEEAKQWEGWGTALKPSYEPIIIARKPCEGTCVANVLKYGVGGINIDECRVETSDVLTHGGNLVTMSGDVRNGRSLGMFQDGTENTFTQNPNGRFPANTILTYDDTDFEEVCGGMPTKDRSNGNIKNPNLENSLGKNGIYGKYSDKQPVWEAYRDSGSAARYFYCAKASKRDRDEGLEEFETGQCTGGGGGIGDYLNDVNSASGKFGSEKAPHKNIHPTVKPTDLMQYLVRLVTPNGGTVLDPFNGSGSTGKAVMYENKDRNKGYKYIGIELNEEYLEISKARIEYVFKEEIKETSETVEGQMNIFDFIGE